MNDKSRQPWLLVLARGQVLNKDAEALGQGPWALWALVLVLTTLLAAFPFQNDKFLTAMRSTNPALYPGLAEVFHEAYDQKWDLKVAEGKLSTGSTVPPQARVGKWLVVFETAGGDPQAIQQAVGSSGTTIQKVAFFGKTHFGLIDQETQAQFDGTWEKLNGFETGDLAKVPPAKMLPIVLYASATGGVVQTIFTVWLLMFVQVVFLTVILGFLLSLSRVQAAGAVAGARRRVGFISSLKTTGFITLGPAFLLCLVLSFLPGSSALGWVGFSLLFGVRVMVLYMARFRNKKDLRGQ